ncbi:DUF5125 domain-containing protein [Albibacterium profundi]|uniref:DUF5125 domain-containing protein n=1 Tax=Albibacterium profundi TaxID=3134906 RepID=A0ABV5CIM1_9SPHI
MKRFLYPMVLLAGVLILASCEKDEVKKVGNPVIESKTEFTSAHFGDSLEFTVNVSDAEVPLSTVKAQLFFSEEMVSETVIRTKTNGDYSGKIYVPYYANIPNGTATLKLVLQNISQTITEEQYDLALTRPDFPYLTLVASDKEYRLERTDLYEYTLDEQLPAKVSGYLKAPAVGDQGNELTFGWEDDAIVEGSTNNIPFSNSSSGQYAITFNTFDYHASPFIIAYAINGTVMQRVDDEHFRLDASYAQDEELIIDGIEDLDNWWIDPDFIKKDDQGKFFFVPQSGNYRITADFSLKYFAVEALHNGEPASLRDDGTGAVWIIGDGIGKPSFATNMVGWNTDKALCLSPIGNKKYQVTVVAGTNVKTDDINFKFFHQKGWGGEFTTQITTTSDLIFIGTGDNGRDPGNLGIVEGQSLEEGATYVLTLDLSAGNDHAVLSVEKL